MKNLIKIGTFKSLFYLLFIFVVSCLVCMYADMSSIWYPVLLLLFLFIMPYHKKI